MGSFCRPVLIAAAGLLALAQEASVPGEYRLKITVDLVQVDATVTDKKGDPVRDLKPEDFVVVIDGETRPAKYATYIDIPTAAPDRSGVRPPPKQTRPCLPRRSCP